MYKNAIASLFAILLAVLTPSSPARAGLTIEPFAGLSGTSFAIFMLDVLLDADGEIAKEAGDSGLITGELGLTVEAGSEAGGIRFEGLVGYYKYRVFDPPATAYYMFMAGVEPYIGLGGLYLGAGGGLFKGAMWTEVLGEAEASNRYHGGWAAWGTVGGIAGGFDLSARVRYHRFTSIEGVRPRDSEFHDDWVVVIRAGIPLNLF
ncbi:MAG: hypothetical protein EPN93_04725 [Spirochaetes bacterium]|nr:MAG: hypothetical protein EPN93_04725 [Spirochaetota bacterium]